MSGKLVGMVFDHYPSGGAELLLAVKLADNAHDDGTHIYPSVGRLAKQTRQSERTVQYQLKRMVESGWLILVREAVGGGRGGGYGRPREYRMHPDWVNAHDVRIPESARPAWPPVEAKADAGAKEMGAKAAPISGGPVVPSIDADRAKEMGADIAPISAKKRVQKPEEMGATAVAEMGATAVAPEPSLTVSRTIPPNPPAGGASAFDTFVDSWPAAKRIKVAKAREVFDAVVLSGRVAASVLVAAAQAQAKSDAWRLDGGKRIPAPDRWLRESRWLDGEAAGCGDGEGWQSSRAGVEARGVALGLGRWDRPAFECGQGESWLAYRGRVVLADQVGTVVHERLAA